MPESEFYKKQGRQGIHGSWWKHLKEYKRDAHKKCRAAIRRLLRRRVDD